MTLEQWAAIAQVAAAIFTFIGVLVSLIVALVAIREVRTDRRVSNAPFLAFEPGGRQYKIEFRDVSDEDKKKLRLPADATWIGLETQDGKIPRLFGTLRNYGPGPAIQSEVTWVPEEIWLGSEKFTLDGEKLSEPKYSREPNTIPASPGHILPNQTAEFFRIPAFISMDFGKQVTKVKGYLDIACFDVFNERHSTRQRFFLATGYEEAPPYIHFTFMDLEVQDSVSPNKRINLTRSARRLSAGR